MAVVKKLTDLPKYFKGYKGKVVLYDAGGKLIARRFTKIKLPKTPDHKRRTKLFGIISKGYAAMLGEDPDKAFE